MSGIGIKASGGVTYPHGWKAAGVAAEVKYRNRRDFAMVVSESVATVAGVFTTNAMAAAPVRYNRALVKGGKVRAFTVNTGFANACTGARGEEDVLATARLAAEALGVPAGEVAVSSTGVIGALLPMDRIEAGIRLAVPALAANPEAADAAARAIMTTDTVPKQVSAAFEVEGREVRIGGMSKGAGMIEPNMATMLAFVTTDAAVAAGDLDAVVREAAGASFNRIVIDNDRSTNDSLFLAANGASGVALAPGKPGWDDFREAVKGACLCLAKQNVMDGEGASKFATVTVTGAKSDADAQLAARAIARSMLVKTSWYGADPNWGRVICAVGYSGAAAEESKTTIRYSGIPAFERGRVAGARELEAMARALKEREILLEVDLGLGGGACTIYTSDLTHEYVNINADYTT